MTIGTVCFIIWFTGFGITLGYIGNGDNELTVEGVIVTAILWPLVVPFCVLYKIGKFFAKF